MHNKLYSTVNPIWTSSKIREAFIYYFKLKNHKFVPSSSVNPKRDDGTYFVNAGMNQFKPVFLGLANIDYKRAVNSQKCIRIGGKHNDLDEVGRDHYHHTFFEMLGNWSFNDYYKKDACLYAWDLLTNVYHLDPSKIYVTYFQGLPSLGMEKDVECFEIWKNIGVPESHIIGQSFKDNFWSMGETGPCGPCTEIHYSRIRGDAAHLINSNSSDVMEIWNIVFMQFDKQLDGKIKKLATNSIDTGMGLERLTAILQNKTSNYDTDLFVPLIQHIEKYSGCRSYEGKLNNAVDTAYRIIADHSRMFTVTISDGLLPGRKGSENKLRNVMYRCIHECTETLQSKPGLSQSIVPVVVDILGNAYPEIKLRMSEVQSIVGETEERYFKSIKLAKKYMSKAINFYNSPQMLDVQQVLEIQEGKFGGGISYDYIQLLAKDFKVKLPTEDKVEQFIKNRKPSNEYIKPVDSKYIFTNADLELFIGKNIKPTEDIHKYDFNIIDSKYEFPNITAKIVAIRDVENNYIEHLLSINNEEKYFILFDRTNFYSESGGQASDFGEIKSKDNIMIANILMASNHNGYIFHEITNFQSTINVGDEVILAIDSDNRRGCMSAHTATHIVNSCLNKVLMNVRQHGSQIISNQFTFEFLCSKATVSIKELEIINSMANEIVDKNLIVSRKVMPFEDAICIKNIRYLPDEIYPNVVNVVSIGDYLGADPNASVELCVGSHVSNTGHIEAIVIINFEGSIQGSKKLIAVTGSLAKKALENAKKLQSLLNKTSNLKNDVTTLNKNIKEINNALSGGMLLPKIFRVNILDELKILTVAENYARNRVKSSNLEEILKITIESSDDHVFSLPFEKNRDLLEVLVKLSPKFPLFVISTLSSQNDTVFGLAYVPKEFYNFSVTRWVESVCQPYPHAIHSRPKGKFSKYRHIWVFSIPCKNNAIAIASVLQSAREFKSSCQSQLKNIM